MQSSLGVGRDARWLGIDLENFAAGRMVALVTLTGLVIRFYLALTSYCIAADGVEYVRMAREFAAGRPQAALDSVFSPLYPWLIAQLHHLGLGYELGGELVSVALGTALIPALFFLIREAHGRRDLAIGAAALAAIHPALAELSASVRTDAGFIALMVAALYLLIGGIDRRRPGRVAAAGALGGIAYLYRAEGIGLLVVVAGLLIASLIFWRIWSRRDALVWLVSFSIPFVTIASPYLLYLHQSTGHWMVSRELNLAASSSVMEIVGNSPAWQALARSGNSSIFAPLLLDPRAYLLKVATDLLMSFYYFAQAISPQLATLLLIGLWIRGRGLFRSFSESFLGGLFIFYFAGFALFNTGPRFMVHLIVYTFGWLMIGIEAVAGWLCRLRPGKGRAIPEFALVAIVAISLLPRTLWPLGYDLRGFPAAARDIAARGAQPKAIAACDARVAYYAGATYIALPIDPRTDWCRWLAREPGADYLMLSSRDERRSADPSRESCLVFIRRYAGTRTRFYDLFAVRRPASPLP